MGAYGGSWGTARAGVPDFAIALLRTDEWPPVVSQTGRPFVPDPVPSDHRYGLFRPFLRLTNAEVQGTWPRSWSAVIRASANRPSCVSGIDRVT